MKELRKTTNDLRMENLPAEIRLSIILIQVTILMVVLALNFNKNYY
jgi:hypothetical protein